MYRVLVEGKNVDIEPHPPIKRRDPQKVVLFGVYSSAAGSLMEIPSSAKVLQHFDTNLLITLS